MAVPHAVLRQVVEPDQNEAAKVCDLLRLDTTGELTDEALSALATLLVEAAEKDLGVEPGASQIDRTNEVPPFGGCER